MDLLRFGWVPKLSELVVFGVDLEFSVDSIPTCVSFGSSIDRPSPARRASCPDDSRVLIEGGGGMIVWLLAADRFSFSI